MKRKIATDGEICLRAICNLLMREGDISSRLKDATVHVFGACISTFWLRSIARESSGEMQRVTPPIQVPDLNDDAFVDVYLSSSIISLSLIAKCASNEVYQAFAFPRFPN